MCTEIRAASGVPRASGPEPGRIRELESAIAKTVTRKVAIPDEGLESLYGALDENLKQLEQAFNVRISTAHRELIIEGDAGDAGRAERVLDQLTDLLRDGYRFADTPSAPASGSGASTARPSRPRTSTERSPSPATSSATP